MVLLHPFPFHFMFSGFTACGCAPPVTVLNAACRALGRANRTSRSCLDSLPSCPLKMMVRKCDTYKSITISIIMFGSVCWGGTISKLDRGRLEKIVRKKKKAGHVVGKPLDSFKTLHEKRLYRKLMQILNDPTHPMRHYFERPYAPNETLL